MRQNLAARWETSHPVAAPAAAAVFDLVGSDATLRQAVKHVLPAGVVMVVGEAGGRVPFGFSLVPYEAHLTSSVWGSYQDLQAVPGLARRGELTWNVEPVPLAQANEAMSRLRNGEVTGRIVLVPWNLPAGTAPAGQPAMSLGASMPLNCRSSSWCGHPPPRYLLV